MGNIDIHIYLKNRRDNMPSLEEFAKTCGYLAGIGALGYAIFIASTTYFKLDNIPSILFSLIALLIIAVVLLNGEVKSIKDNLKSKSTSTKKKGAIDIVTAIIIIVILFLLIYLLLQTKVGG